jgi:hypothetical protein
LKNDEGVKLLTALCCVTAARVSASTLTWVGNTGHSVADRAWHANHLGFDDLARDTSRLRDHLGFTDLTTGGVRNFAGPHFLCHRAGRVRNLFGDRFAGP